MAVHLHSVFSHGGQHRLKLACCRPFWLNLLSSSSWWTGDEAVHHTCQ